MVTWGGMGEAEGKGRQARRAMERPSPISLLCVLLPPSWEVSSQPVQRDVYWHSVVTQQSSKCDLLPPTGDSCLHWYLTL